MADNINIRFEKGVFRISAEIPVTKAREAIESIVSELSSRLLGEERPEKGLSLNAAPKTLDEKDAAKYIGRSVSFLRTCRYKARRGEPGGGPKYIRIRNKFIAYPVKELDEWLNQSQLFSTCLEEKVYAGRRQILEFPAAPRKAEVVQNA
jgi:hypothetical protein